jgi:hypothetical protein
VTTLRIDRRFCGPPDSGNGGYTCGLLARALGGPAEVTLRLPPPLERELRIEQAAGTARLLDGDAIVAEGVRVEIDLEPIAPVSLAAENSASAHSEFRDPAVHAFPTCFTCGPHRHDGDGLRIFAGRVPGTEVFAAPWVPPAGLDETIVWAALDCPTAAVIYLDAEHPPPTVLGRMAARIDRLPAPGEPHVIMSWLRSRDGRKINSAGALYDASGELLAVSRTTWIELSR